MIDFWGLNVKLFFIFGSAKEDEAHLKKVNLIEEKNHPLTPSLAGGGIRQGTQRCLTLKKVSNIFFESRVFGMSPEQQDMKKMKPTQESGPIEEKNTFLSCSPAC